MFWTGVLAALAVSGALLAYATFGWDPARVGGDAWNYLAAGERLNAGHDLYAIGPGDRPVPLNPPYWSAPLLAPPPIAVAWRPLALFGDPAMAIWGVASLVAAATAVLVLARGGRASFVPVAVLAVPVTLTALSGNFGAIQLAALVAMWVWRDHPLRVGAILACLVAVKVTPVMLVLWLAAGGRWRAVLAFVASGLAILIATTMAAGAETWWSWLDAARDAAPSPLSLGTLMGADPLMVTLTLTLTTAMAATLRRDRLVFVVAVSAAVLASPSFYLQTIGPLAAVGAVCLSVRPSLPGTDAPVALDHG